MGIDVIKIGKVLQEAGKIDLYQQVLEMQAKMNEMQENSHKLKKENRKLKEQADLKKKLKFEENALWMVEGAEKEGPFCSSCMDTDNKLIRMYKSNQEGRFHCPNCKIGIGKMPASRTFHQPI